jgi:hypothetical protein
LEKIIFVINDRLPPFAAEEARELPTHRKGEVEMRRMYMAAAIAAALFMPLSAQAKFTIDWPSASYPCSTLPAFCDGYHGSNG